MNKMKRLLLSSAAIMLVLSMLLTSSFAVSAEDTSDIAVNAQDTVEAETRRERETDNSYVDKPLDPPCKESPIGNMTEEERIAATERSTGVKYPTYVLAPHDIPWYERGETIVDKVCLNIETAEKLVQTVKRYMTSTAIETDTTEPIVSVDSSGRFVTASELSLDEETAKEIAWIYFEQFRAEYSRCQEYEEFQSIEYMEEEQIWIVKFALWSEQEKEDLRKQYSEYSYLGFAGAALHIAIGADGTLQRCYIS